MEKHYYPAILSENRGQRTLLRTILRKEHKGNWYLWEITKSFENPADVTKWKETELAVTKQIHVEAYICLIRGIIDPTLKMSAFDEFVFKLDYNQESESERLKKIMDV